MQIQQAAAWSGHVPNDLSSMVLNNRGLIVDIAIRSGTAVTYLKLASPLRVSRCLRRHGFKRAGDQNRFAAEWDVGPVGLSFGCVSSLAAMTLEC